MGVAVWLCTAAALSQVPDSQTRINSPSFHTLQTKVNGSDQLPPVIVLGSDDRLTVSFDEIADDRRYLRCRLVHCDAQWRPDRLLPAEYVDGFNEAVIDDYEFSQATTVHYVNYQVSIPSADLTPLLSGNYLLQIYDESDPDEVLLQCRFSVLQPQVEVYPSVTSRTDIDYNGYHQQLSVAVDTKGSAVADPFNHLLLTATQNSRWDNAVVIVHPTRLSGTTAHYEHLPSLIFPAGNEYRRMEIISTTYPGMGVEAIQYEYPFYHVDLTTDITRADASYVYDQTQHGRFRIREYNSDSPDTEADYVLTHFSLIPPVGFDHTSADIFIEGDLFQRRFSPESRMVFDRSSGLYTLTSLLKQGAYNYQYVTVDRGASTLGRTAAVEGDKYQTANEYYIYVYHRPPGARYDSLVGFGTVMSGL